MTRKGDDYQARARRLQAAADGDAQGPAGADPDGTARPPPAAGGARRGAGAGSACSMTWSRT